MKHNVYNNVLIVLSFLIYFVHAHTRRKEENKTCFESRILGGAEVNIKYFPFMVAIVINYAGFNYPEKFVGGANIVSEYWALTAAHCIKQIDRALIKHGFALLRGGTDYWEEELAKRRADHLITDFHIHPKYNLKARYDCDIALVKVKQPFVVGLEKPIVIASENYYYEPDIPATTSGWGTLEYKIQQPSPHLRAVTINVFNDTVCRKAYNGHPYNFTNNMICGGSIVGGKDSCSGDSGGPLVQAEILIGLVSYGNKCGLKKFPGVYTKIGNFQNWIKQLQRKLDINFGIMFKNKIPPKKLKSIRTCRRNMLKKYKNKKLKFYP